MAISKNGLGFAIDNPVRAVFFFFEFAEENWVLRRIEKFLESSSHELSNNARMPPQLNNFFPTLSSIVCGQKRGEASGRRREGRLVGPGAGRSQPPLQHGPADRCDRFHPVH